MRLFQTIVQIIIATSVVNCVPVPPLVDGPSDAGRRNSRALPDPDPNVVIPVNAKAKLGLKVPGLPQPPSQPHGAGPGFGPQPRPLGPQVEQVAQVKQVDGSRQGEGKGSLTDSVAYPLPPPGHFYYKPPRPLQASSAPGPPAVGTPSTAGTFSPVVAVSAPRHLMPQQQPNPDLDDPPSSHPKDQNPPPPALKSADLASDPPSRRSSVVGNLGHSPLNAPPDRRSPPKISGNDVISRRLSKLADEDLRFRFMSLLARRAIESLDD
jgi:hypothetical protein